MVYEPNIREFFFSLVHEQLGTTTPVSGLAMERYIAGLLEEFTTTDRLYEPLRSNGENITTLNDFLLAADPVTGTASSFDQEWEMRKYAGDVILFFFGMYPEGIKRHPLLRSESENRLEKIAIESYFIASTFTLCEYEKQAPILATLSEHFVLYAYQLSCIRAKFNGGNPLLGNGR